MPETKVLPADLVTEYADARPTSRAAFERAGRVLPGGLTHETRKMVPFLPYIARARGARKWDLDGHEYVDYACGHGSMILGHAHPAIVEAVTRQISLGTHPGANHALEVEWAERILRLVPGAELVRFTSSGTEATLLAIRIARAATGRPKLIKFQGHFHGWHDAVNPGMAPPYDAVPAGIPAAIARDTIVLPPSLEAVQAALGRDPEIGAVIIEASGASWGTVPLPPGFLPGLRALTAARGIVMIADEVVTGFRWAPGGALEVAGTTADLVTLAKILAGGLPGGAVAGRRDLLGQIALPDGSPRQIRHPGTFNANPLSAAAGIACLEIVRDPAVQDGCAETAAAVRNGLNGVMSRRGVRGVAYGERSVFHLAFDTRLAPGDPTALRHLTPDDLKRQRGQPAFSALTIAMLIEGVHVFGGGGLLSMAHGEAEIAKTLEAFDRSVGRLGDVLPR